MSEIWFDEVQKKVKELKDEFGFKNEEIEKRFAPQHSLGDVPAYSEVLVEELEERKKFLEEAKKLKLEFQEWCRTQHEKKIEYHPVSDKVFEGAEMDLEIQDKTAEGGVCYKDDIMIYVHNARKGKKIRAKITKYIPELKIAWAEPLDRPM